MVLRGGLEFAFRAVLESRGRCFGVRLLMVFGFVFCWLWGFENSCNFFEFEFFYDRKRVGKD